MPGILAILLSETTGDASLARALIDVVVVALIAAAVGSFIVLRGTAFLGDALAHSIFPGIVIAFLLDANLLVGAMVAGLITAALMGVLTASTRVSSDTAIGVIFTTAFALGVLILSAETIEGEELEHILFGDPLAVRWFDVALTAGVGAVVACVFVLMRRAFVIAAFDPTGARAMGLPVVAIDALLLAMTALTVVISFKAVGNILVIALLITPPATARIFSDRLTPMLLLAAAFGVAASVSGVVLGYYTDVSPGGTTVLIAGMAFIVAWLLAPEHGVLGALLGGERRSSRRKRKRRSSYRRSRYTGQPTRDSHGRRPRPHLDLRTTARVGLRRGLRRVHAPRHDRAAHDGPTARDPDRRQAGSATSIRNGRPGGADR
jgi:manganese/iron transport system permease protein